MKKMGEAVFNRFAEIILKVALKRLKSASPKKIIP